MYDGDRGGKRSKLRQIAKSLFRLVPKGRRFLANIEALMGERAAFYDELVKQRNKNNTLSEGMAHLESCCDELRTENHALRAGACHLESCIESKITLLERYGEPPWVPNGHFYSPIHSLGEVRQEVERIYPPPPRSLPDIDLREREQLALLEELLPFFVDFPFQPSALEGHRYGYGNSAYTYGDSVFLNAMLRHIRPARLIEIGSGHSSCATLDTNDLWLDGNLKCTFIEPYPQLLYSLLKPSDMDDIIVIPTRVQDVDIAVFKQLESNDVLFIDSTHVSKVGSDVNRLFFEVFPLLSDGVYIHIHDVHYPFEYPKSWVLDDGRAWNEQYLLRAFLQNNHMYEIVLFNTFLTECHPNFFERHLPGALRDRGGSIWLRKNLKRK